MPNPHLLVIALATNELGSPHTAAVLRSAREVLGPSVTVRVEVVDDAAKRSPNNATQPSSAYAWLSWDRDARAAHLRCYIPESGRWIQRDVTFEEQDPENERGRTLGFVIASIFVEGHETANPPVVPAPSKPKEEPAPKPKLYQLAAAADVAMAHDATSLGAWVHAQRRISSRFSLGVGSDARFGALTEASAGARFFAVGAVATLRGWPKNGAAWLGIRSFGGAESVTFTHKSEDDPTAVAESAWVPRLDLLLHGSLELEGSSVLFFDLGTNYRFGSTDIYVRGLRRAHIPNFIGIARIGVGARF